MAVADRMRKRVRGAGFVLLGALALVQCRASDHSSRIVPTEGGALRIEIDGATGLPVAITSRRGTAERQWINAPVELTVNRAGEDRPAAVVSTSELRVEDDRAVWDLVFSTNKPRVEHEIEINLPVLFTGARLFTPSQYGVMDVNAYPTFEAAAYGSYDWNDGQAYVLPLVTILSPVSDQALTLALPADQNIPHLQIGWTDGRWLRLRMGRRGIGGDEPTTVRLLLYTHAADYRSAIQAYADDFPAWFHPPLPRGSSEGTFWYHHIHEHPDFDELARQHVRYTWTSFWFPWLGKFLPEEQEWFPYSYARWWSLREKLSDEQIRSFAGELREHGIGTFAYFNVTEYGGRGGDLGDSAAADRIVEEQLAPALVRNSDGEILTTWEGSKVINPGRGLPYRPLLLEQAHRHLERLPELEGFIVDRLDWASRFDHGADDGLSMIGERPVENLAVPVGDAVQELCRLSHEAGWRVFVNQFWRVEILKDTDGYCHENDCLPAMGYLSPFRPASAWHQREGYTGDLLAFEAQMKRRLHWALFPQLIAHEFPVSQQAPDERAAGMMELYAPLFEPLIGKEQVLLPHCVEVTGPNEVNLFRNGSGHYVAPVNSRVRFLSRPPRFSEPATLTLRVPDAGALSWAQVYSLEGPPYRAKVTPGETEAFIEVAEHGASSVVVIGEGEEPPLAAVVGENDPPSLGTGPFRRFDQLRSRWFPSVSMHVAASDRPSLSGIEALELEVSGDPVGVSRPTTVVDVFLDGRKVGELRDREEGFDLESSAAELPEHPPVLALLPRDEGSWFVPGFVEWIARTKNGRRHRVACWIPGEACEAEGIRGLRLPLHWCEPVTLPDVTARFEAEDLQTGGTWPGTFGELGSWTPGKINATATGFALEVRQGGEFLWAAAAANDPRVPHDSTAPPRAVCWFDTEAVELQVTPPDESPYRLTVYLLDYDRTDRHQAVAVQRDRKVLDEREVTPEKLARGAHLTWTVTGSVTLRVKNLAEVNAVISAVFLDSARD